MARSARSRSPVRQTRSLFASLREEQLPIESTPPRPRRTLNLRKTTSSSRKFGFSKMDEDSTQAELVMDSDMMMTEDSNNSVDETTSTGSFEVGSLPLSPTGPLSSSAPGGLTLHQFLKQRRSKDERQSLSKNTVVMKEEEQSIADASMQSMDTLRVRSKKTSSSTRTRRNKLLSKNSNNKKVLSIQEATTNVFLQLSFIGDGSVNVRHHVGLPKAPRDDGIVIMQDIAIVSKETAKALRVPCPVRVGATNSAA